MALCDNCGSRNTSLGFTFRGVDEEELYVCPSCLMWGTSDLAKLARAKAAIKSSRTKRPKLARR